MSESMNGFGSRRDRIDIIDRQVIGLLVDRFEITDGIGEEKADAGSPVHDPAREEEQGVEWTNKILEAGGKPGQILPLMRGIVAASRESQQQIVEQHSAGGS